MAFRKIDGEDLVVEPKQKHAKTVIVVSIVSVLAFFIICGLMRSLLLIVSIFVQQAKQPLGQASKIDFSVFTDNFFNLDYAPIPFAGYFMAIILSVAFAFIVTRNIRFSMQDVAYGQKGDSRFSTLDEIKDQYPAIPDKKDKFKGYGGVPISHYKDKYYVDTDTVHTGILGTSRSGKGENIVIPLIDNLSRANQQSSMVLNDPKGELYNGSVDTLKERGYDVYLLNLDDPSQGMSYNPLSVIIKAWQTGDIERGMQLVNSLTYTLYHDPHAGANAWVYEGAQKAVNGMVLSLIEYCIKNDMPEKITLNNVIDMLNELGTVDYVKDPKNPYDKTNVLDEYFKSLPQGSIAKRQFGSTSFSGDKAKGSIYSTIIQKLDPFSMPKNARMTSMNTLDLKTVGFPKYVSFKLPDNYYNKRIRIMFLNKENQKKSEYIVKVGFGGFVEYNFEEKLDDDDKVIIKYIDETDSSKKASGTYSIKLNLEDSNHVAETSEIVNKLRVERFKLVYSDKPIAVFMKIPDYDSSNNNLASLFVSQLYSELAKQCSYVKGNKTTRRVHFILDEFGNMIPINDMGQIMTVSAGRNILFNLVLQSYSQLYDSYGKEVGQTIKENCQNIIFIKSTDKGTINEISDMAGRKTIESANVNKSMMNINQSLNVNSDSIPIITAERLDGLLIGETVVLRPLHRENLKHKKVRPFPIFNTKKTAMPYAWTFLGEWINPKNDPNLLDIYSPHANLDLSALSIDFGDFVDFSPLAKNAYDASKKDMSVTVHEVQEKETVDFGDNDESANMISDEPLETTNPKKSDISFQMDILSKRSRAIAEIRDEIQQALETKNRPEFLSITSKLPTDERKMLERTYQKYS